MRTQNKNSETKPVHQDWSSNDCGMSYPVCAYKGFFYC